MEIRLVDRAWNAEMERGLEGHIPTLYVVSPFIKHQALGRLLRGNVGSLKVVTRFNMADFASGVSDIEALRMVLRHGGEVRGIRGLHSKLYVFGSARAIVTSANLTLAALDRNQEFGVVTVRADDVDACVKYFDGLWKAGRPTSLNELDKWDAQVQAHQAKGGATQQKRLAGDFGGKMTGMTVGDRKEGETSEVGLAYASASQAFVKFLGEGTNRVPLSFLTYDEVKRSGAHWSLAYPATKRPRSVNDGDLMFIARLTSGPEDIRIFGRGLAMKHVEGRDDATVADIAARPWKSTWNRYVRVHDAEFIAGTMDNGVSLNELMETLKSNSFASTKRNAELGRGNVEPRRAYAQQAQVMLTEEAMQWLNVRFEEALRTVGAIPSADLRKLDWPSLPAGW